MKKQSGAKRAKKSEQSALAARLCSTRGCENDSLAEWECCARCLQFYVDRDHDNARRHCRGCGALIMVAYFGEQAEPHRETCPEVARWKREAMAPKAFGPELPSWWHSAQHILEANSKRVALWLHYAKRSGSHGSSLAFSVGDDAAEYLLRLFEATGQLRRGPRMATPSQAALQGQGVDSYDDMLAKHYEGFEPCNLAQYWWSA